MNLVGYSPQPGITDSDGGRCGVCLDVTLIMQLLSLIVIVPQSTDKCWNRCPVVVLVAFRPPD